MYRALIVAMLSLPMCDAIARDCSIPLQPTATAFTTTVHIGPAGPFRFLVDTGATTTVIDRTVANAIGLQPVRTIEALSTTGSLDVQETIVDQLRAGSVSVAHMPVLVMRLPRFASHGRVDGILGMSFFAGRAILVDSRRRCIELDAPAPNGTEVVAHEIAGRIAIEIGAMAFTLDSGASFPVLLSSRARALAAKDGSMEMTSAAGRRRVITATIPVFRIGPLILRDVAAAFAAPRDSREDGLLPVTLFASVYIAADRKRVILR